MTTLRMLPASTTGVEAGEALVAKGALTRRDALSASRKGARSPVRWVRHASARVVSFLLLIFMVLAALVLIGVPMVTGSQTYTVLTNSMAPHYAPGTFLVVKPIAFDELRVGDVITYQIDSGKPAVITHRIIEVGATQSGQRVFTTKGDNNSLADPNPVEQVQVKGKLLYAVPLVGFAANAVGQSGRSAALPLAAAGLIGFGVITMIRGAKNGESSRKKAGHRA